MDAQQASPRVQLALDRTAAAIASPAAAVVAGALTVGVVLQSGSPDFSALGILASAAGAAVLGILGWRARSRGLHHGHAALATVALVPLALALLHLVEVRDPARTPLLGLAVVGHAILAVHAGWHLAVSVVAIAGFLGVVATDPDPVGWLPMALVLASGSAVAGVAQILRVRDRTRLEQARADAEDGEARVRALSEATFEGVALHEDGRILVANAAFGALLGHPVSALVGRPVNDFVAPASRGAIAASLQGTNRFAAEVQLLRRDGSFVHADVAGGDLPFEGRTVRVLTVRDASERRAAQEAARERDRLRTLNDLRTSFINDAAHQLHTPLTPIKINVHMLASGQYGPLNERQREAVDSIERNTARLGLLAKMLLGTSTRNADEAPREPVVADVSGALRAAFRAHADRAARLGVVVSLPEPRALLVQADPARVEQALRGLVGEMLDTAGPRARLEVTARAEGAHASVALRKLSDAPDVPHAAGEQREPLYVDLARRLVAPGGGTVEVRAEPAGLHYLLRLPLARASTNQASI